MRGYQAGDLAAFDHLYAGLAPVLRRYLLGLTREAAWTDDLVQETFLQIHRARQTYDPSQPVKPWAFAIARHVFLMSRRSRTRRHDFDRAELSDIEQLPQPGAENALLAKDQVRRGLSTLKAGTRRAVWLHHVLGWRFEEVGRRLGIKEEAAKLRASRGMHALKRELERKDRADGD